MAIPQLLVEILMAVEVKNISSYGWEEKIPFRESHHRKVYIHSGSSNDDINMNDRLEKIKECWVRILCNLRLLKRGIFSLKESHQQITMEVLEKILQF